MSATPTLACTVRGCGAALWLEERVARCPRGHVFDRAAKRYWNLLQPQDRRSLAAGDTRAAALARRRLAAAGHLRPLFDGLGALLDGARLARGAAVLDVGCGEGSVLEAVARSPGFVAHGVDLSRPSIELAARAWPQATWVIANADRRLPYDEGSFDSLLSVTSRLQPAEFRRVLVPGGVFVLAVPGADDLVELRAAAKGEGVLRPRLESALAGCAAGFEVVTQRTLRWQLELDRAGLEDLLASSYRGARRAERVRLEELEGATATMSRDLALLRTDRPPPRSFAALRMTAKRLPLRMSS